MLKDRFKEARQRKGLSQEQVADLAGVSQTTVYKIESGQTLRPKGLEDFASLFEVDPSWLQFGTGAGALFDHPVLDSGPLGQDSVPKFVNVPVYDVSLSAGHGSHTDEDKIIENYPVSEMLLLNNQMHLSEAAIVKIAGDSMESTLNNGDMVLINTSVKKPTSNKIFAFAFDNELKVKRFSRQLDNSWRIISDNEDKGRYRDELVSHHNIIQLRMIGQVVTIVERSLL